MTSGRRWGALRWSAGWLLARFASGRDSQQVQTGTPFGPVRVSTAGSQEAPTHGRGLRQAYREPIRCRRCLRGPRLTVAPRPTTPARNTGGACTSLLRMTGVYNLNGSLCQAQSPLAFRGLGWKHAAEHATQLLPPLQGRGKRRIEAEVSRPSELAADERSGKTGS